MASLPLKFYVETSGEPHSQPGDRTCLLPSGLILVNIQLESSEVNNLPLIPSQWGKVGFLREKKSKVDWLVEGKGTMNVPWRFYGSQGDMGSRRAVPRKQLRLCTKIYPPGHLSKHRS